MAKQKKTDLKVGLPPSRAVTALEQNPLLHPVLQGRGHTIEEIKLMTTYFMLKKLLKDMEEKK